MAREDEKSQTTAVGADAAGLSRQIGELSPQDLAVGDLQARLASESPDAAWREFLTQYSPLIMQITRRYEGDANRITECYEHVCAALSDQGFRRLRSFRLDGRARFRTWLMAVTANLCRDWQRHRRGRYRPVRSVAALPELEQLVYRLIFVHRMPRAECLRALERRFPDVTERQLAEINGRLFNLLTPQQRWQLGARAASGTATEGSALESLDDLESVIEDPAAGPEQWVEAEQVQANLQAALADLPAEQRLLLRLRYEQDLTIAEVARLTRLQDPFRAHRKVQEALSALQHRLKRGGEALRRKKP